MLLTSIFASAVFADVTLKTQHEHKVSSGTVADMPTSDGVDITNTTASITEGEPLTIGELHPLEAAIKYLDDVKTGTVTLKEDIALTKDISLYHCFSSYNYGTKTPTQMLVIDLNNKKLNLSTNCLSVGLNPPYKNTNYQDDNEETQETNIIYIKNGTIQGNGVKLINVEGRNTKLFLDNVILTNENSLDTSTVISSNSGETYFINSKINSNGYGVFASMEKTSYYNMVASCDEDCIAKPTIEGDVVFDTKNDCIHYQDNYENDSDKQINHLGGTVKLNLGSKLNSNNGYAVYYDAYSPLNSCGVNIFNTNVNSYDGFYLKNGKLLISDSFISLNKDDNNVVYADNSDSSCIGIIDLEFNKFKNVDKIIKTTSTSLANGFIYKDNVAVVKTNNDPFITDISIGVIDNAIFSKDIQDNKYDTYPLKKSVVPLVDFRRDYDPDNLLGVDSDLYMIYTSYSKIKTIADFKAALNNHEQQEIYFDETVGTIDFNDELVTINRPVSIFLNGITIRNAKIENTSINGNVTFNNGRLVNDDTILTNSGNIQLGDMEIVNNGTDCYAIDNSIVKNGDALNQLIMNSSSITSNNGYGVKLNSAASNPGAHIMFTINNSNISAKEKAVYSKDIILDLTLANDSTINSTNGNAIVSEDTKLNTCNHITINGNVTAQNGIAIVSNSCYSAVGIYNGLISGVNAIKASLSEDNGDSITKTFRLDIFGGSLTGRNDAIVTNVDVKDGEGNKFGSINIKAGKLKAGDNYKILSSIDGITDSINKNVEGGWYCLTEVQATEFQEYNHNGEAGTFALIQAKNTGDYKYTMARVLGVDDHKIYETNGLNCDVNINTSQLSKEAGAENSDLLMSLTPLENNAIKEQFDSKLNDGDEYFAYYDFDLISLNDSKTNITETSNYQILGLKAVGINGNINESTNLTIVHKHGNLEPKQLPKIDKNNGETEEEYIARIKNNNIDSCYYLTKVSNDLYINVVTKKFSTFAFLDGDLKQSIIPPSDNRGRYKVPNTGVR